jgi:hypothetical protein
MFRDPTNFSFISKIRQEIKISPKHQPTHPIRLTSFNSFHKLNLIYHHSSYIYQTMPTVSYNPPLETNKKPQSHLLTINFFYHSFIPHNQDSTSTITTPHDLQFTKSTAYKLRTISLDTIDIFVSCKQITSRFHSCSIFFTTVH